MPLLPFDPDDLPEDPGDGSAYVERLNRMTDEAVEHIAEIMLRMLEREEDGGHEMGEPVRSNPE